MIDGLFSCSYSYLISETVQLISIKLGFRESTLNVVDRFHFSSISTQYYIHFILTHVYQESFTRQRIYLYIYTYVPMSVVSLK